MGLPINKLIVATNQNDILHRAISKGSYEVEKVVRNYFSKYGYTNMQVILKDLSMI